MQPPGGAYVFCNSNMFASRAFSFCASDGNSASVIDFEWQVTQVYSSL